MDPMLLARLLAMNLPGLMGKSNMFGGMGGGEIEPPMPAAPQMPMMDPMAQARMDTLRQNTVPMDMEGMDPEMQSLMGGETARLMKQRAMYAPQSMGRSY